MTDFLPLTEDNLGRQIRPVLFNTAKDGSGTWYFPVVDTNGKLKVGGSPLFSVATGAVALAKTLAPGAIFRLLRVELHLGAAPTQETFSIKLDAGDGATYDVVLYSRDMSVGTPEDLVIPFGKGYEFEADDEIDVAWANTDTETYGLRIVYELL